jgi:hypothetical protein
MDYSEPYQGEWGQLMQISKLNNTRGRFFVLRR